MKFATQLFTLSLSWLVLSSSCFSPVQAADLIVSAQDGKFARVNGQSTYPDNAPPDSLAVIDAAQNPPKIVALIEGTAVTVQGPPQAVAITPDGKLAFVGAPSHYDKATKTHILDKYITVVELTLTPPAITNKIDLGVQVNGLAINPDGTLLLAAGLDGNIYVFAILGPKLVLKDKIKVSDQGLASASFTPDGKSAIVSMRYNGGAAVLDIAGSAVSLSDERISTGVAPYTVDVSSAGKWAVISNAGLAGLVDQNSPGDKDSVALIDISKRPFQTVDYLTVPATPESVAISPDGQWIVVQSLNGSNLPNTAKGYHKTSLVTLFKADGKSFKQVDQLPVGVAAQGIIFAKDNKTILVQDNVEKKIAILTISTGKLKDTGQALTLSAGPVAIRSMPR